MPYKDQPAEKNIFTIVCLYHQNKHCGVSRWRYQGGIKEISGRYPLGIMLFIKVFFFLVSIGAACVSILQF